MGVVRSFMGMHLEEKRSYEEQLLEDEVFYNFTRNFYLGLFYRTIVFLPSALKQRLVNILHVFIVEELLFKLRRRETPSNVDVKYKLKSHYLYVLYLLILTNRELEEETVKVYFEFL